METLNLIQGDTEELDISFTDDDGNPFDITGYDIVLSLTSDMDKSPDLSVSLSIVDSSGGLAKASLSATQTSNLEGMYYADIQLSKSGTVVSTNIFLINVNKDVSQ